MSKPIDPRRVRRWCAAGATALLVVVALPAPHASAAEAITIGSNLDNLPGGNLFIGATVAQRTLNASHQAPGGMTSPVNGVVVRWRVRSAAGDTAIKFRVVRPGADASEATGAGTSASGVALAGTTTSFGLNPGLPIRVNDGIGIDLPHEANVPHIFGDLPFENRMNSWAPPLMDGAAPRGPDHVFSGTELLLQAVIEPDKDGDRLGDISQDPDGGNPSPAPCGLVNLNILNVRVLDLACL
jgi:hypothetical protein